MNNNPDRHKYFSKNGAEMLQTVAIRTPKYLCIKDNSLIIREKGSSVVLGKIALSDIWVIIIDNPQVTMTSALISGIKQGRKPELTIFTSKKRTFPQAFSVRKSVVQAVEKFLQKEKLYVKRDTNVPFSARPEKKALRTAKVHSYPRSILKAQFSMS